MSRFKLGDTVRIIFNATEAEKNAASQRHVGSVGTVCDPNTECPAVRLDAGPVVDCYAEELEIVVAYPPEAAQNPPRVQAILEAAETLRAAHNRYASACDAVAAGSEALKAANAEMYAARDALSGAESAMSAAAIQQENAQ